MYRGHTCVCVCGTVPNQQVQLYHANGKRDRVLGMPTRHTKDSKEPKALWDMEQRREQQNQIYAKQQLLKKHMSHTATTKKN